MNTLKELYNYREMIVSLVKKDLRGRYKGSVLGFLWTFINPLLQLIVYTMVFSVILKSDIEKYYLHLFVALIPWIFFAASITGGSTSILGQKDMIKKIYFPRMIMPISYVTTCFVNMLYCFIVIFIVIIISRVPINIVAIICLIPVMAVEYILCLGVALLSSSITVYFRDFEHILGIFTMALQYLTPVMYPISIVPENVLPLFMINPMTPVITAYRDILYYSKVPDLKTLLHALILGLIVLVIGYFVFQKLQKHFAEEL